MSCVHIIIKKSFMRFGISIIVSLVFFTISLPNAYSTGLLFVDKTIEAGLSYELSKSYGLSWGDFNNDNMIDLYIGNHVSPPSLYKNSGNGTFEDITLQSGIVLSGDFHGASWGDFDNDGDLDLYQSLGADRGYGTKTNYLFDNGNGFFTDIAGSAGLQDPEGRGRTPVWFDYNNDGRLDLFVANQKRVDAPSILFRNDGDGLFTDVTGNAGLNGIERAIGAYVADINIDGAMDLILSNRIGGISLYLNNSDGTFRDITIESGLSNVNSAKDLSLGDYDNDGLIDIFVSRSSSSIDVYEVGIDNLYYKLKLNDTEKGFDFEVNNSSIVEFTLYLEQKIPASYIYIGSGKYNPGNNPFSLDAGSPENYGEPIRTNPGIYIWIDSSANQWHIRYFTGAIAISFPLDGIISTSGSLVRVNPVGLEINTTSYINKLFRNLGSEQFTDVTDSVGLGSDFGNAQSSVFTDFDNDGDLDIYVVHTGGIFNAVNKLYENDGQGYFTDVAAEAGAQALAEGKGESVAVADFNNDGFMDMMILNGAGDAPFGLGQRVLLENQKNNNNWLQIKLIGIISNKDGVGAIVEVETGSLMLTRQQTGGMHCFTQNSQILQFGLANESLVDRITVRWPSGIVQQLSNIDVNQRLVIEEPKVSITLTPYGVSVPRGGVLSLQATMINNTSKYRVFLFATNVTLPNGVIYPAFPVSLYGPIELTLAPGEIITEYITHNISLDAPLGGYIYNGYVGKGLWTIWDEDRLDFTVIP